MTFNFLHLTFQECIAANYMTLDQMKSYVCFISTCGVTFMQTSSPLHHTQQGTTIKDFLSGGDNSITISCEFLRDQLKCFRLFCCFHEAQDHQMCKSIEEAEIFNKKVIRLVGTSLSASDVECISLFLTSYKQWVEFNLSGCYIQDHGLHIIYKHLNHSGVILNSCR